ncbi:MAG: anti-sigma factor antagonist [Armatimonadetes bacterium]|nr:anti-sigma factor antagonist [Armatimonadota bacterium]MCX7966994.1 anti-sigma factor antagonist [Armatimonadota bacterium]MDW8142151.1 anti-sigma factor antagonist [Armatimonadota bacterium]
MPLQVGSRELEEGIVFLELKGSMDAAVQNELIDAFNSAIRQAEKGVIVSLDSVDFMDSSGIGALMRAWGEAENNGLKFAVVLRQPRLRKLLDTLGLLDTLPNFLTVGDAINEWRTQEEREKWEVQPLTQPVKVEGRGQEPQIQLPTAARWRMELQLACEPELISVARLACATFASQFGFSLDELEDIKLAVSEACTNVVQHAYEDRTGQQFTICCWTEENSLVIEVRDKGRGLQGNIQGRFGMKIIRAVMDFVEFHSEEGKGTIVRMVKRRRI